MFAKVFLFRTDVTDWLPYSRPSTGLPSLWSVTCLGSCELGPLLSFMMLLMSLIYSQVLITHLTSSSYHPKYCPSYGFLENRIHPECLHLNLLAKPVNPRLSIEQGWGRADFGMKHMGTMFFSYLLPTLSPSAGFSSSFCFSSSLSLLSLIDTCSFSRTHAKPGAEPWDLADNQGGLWEDE